MNTDPGTEGASGVRPWSSDADPRRIATRICAAAARTAGLRPTDLEWVRLGERAVLRMDADRVIARVERPGVTADDAAREIAVTRWLSSSGIPVTHPLPVDQPVVVDDIVVTFWYGLSGRPGTTEQLGHLLRRIHDLQPPAELARPAYPFLRLSARIEHAAGLTESDRTALAGLVRATAADYAGLGPVLTPGFVHGDAACHNVLSTAGGPVVFDFEYAGWGHREWDLSQNAAYLDIGWLSEADYAAFHRAYGRDVRTLDGYPILRRARLLREITGLAQRSGGAHDPALRAEISRRITDLEAGGPPSRWRNRP
ncbi:hypothetical protein GCM10010191_60030 [Actinomadura vinacea]|uniref:Aminoglycoside phosphotransferase domain-containing protein n=1 Tax=Actinomadura vinacea TaxID=115336 RepID=A0ABN3JSY2_9ACTN